MISSMIGFSLVVAVAFLLAALLPGLVYFITENIEVSQFIFGCGIIFFVVVWVLLSGTVP